MTPIVEMRDITKRFGHVQALSGVTLELGAGEVLGIVGDNGAGKSTLMKILAGAERATSGEIVVEGSTRRFSSPLDARNVGIEVVYQHYALSENLDSVANVMLGREVTHSGLLGRLGVLDERRMRAQAKQALSSFNVGLRPAKLVLPVGNLSGGQQQAVAIARAADFGTRLVILDEPTANLGERNAEKVLAIIGQLRQREVAVIFISHRIHEVVSVCDRIQILKEGHTAATRIARDTTRNEIIALMMGEAT